MITLAIVFGVFGWHGGTRLQAHKHFMSLPKHEQDAVCNALMAAIDERKLDACNLIHAQWFFNARIGVLS